MVVVRVGRVRPLGRKMLRPELAYCPTTQTDRLLARVVDELTALRHGQCPECHGAMVAWERTGSTVDGLPVYRSNGRPCQHPMHGEIRGRS